MICPRCSGPMTVGHSCADDSKPCAVCGRFRVVLVVLHDQHGYLSETQPCIGCLLPNTQVTR